MTNTNLVMGPRRVIETKIDWPDDRRSPIYGIRYSWPLH
jgi:hypothetical protein